MNKPDLILMAVSAGGPDTLRKIIPNIDKNLGVPILLVQHMGEGRYIKTLAESLNSVSKVEVKEASLGEKIQGSKVYIAPGNYHMKLDGSKVFPKIELTNLEPKVNYVRPAADVLFNNVALNYKGKNVLVIIGTGMGKDGLLGLYELKKNCNCYCITESKFDCLIYGMPKAIDDAGLSDEVVSLNNIANRINSLSMKGW